MSTASPAQRGSGRLSLSRVARLAQKELRETLRDRRTILTLVLMPLLVYPVLSVALRQFLLSSFQHSGELQWIIAAENQDDGREFLIRLQQGDRLLQEQGTLAATRSADGSLILGADLGGKEPAFDKINFRLSDNLERDVAEQLIDLGVRLLPPPVDPRSRPDAQQTFQLVFRPNTPISRQAASYVERRLRAVNDSDFRRRLLRAGDSGLQRAGWQFKAVAEEQGHSFWLGSLVPLVLILMTITGAVYPAIDLTAGERERGTLESLMAAPVPRLALLLAKYVAVLTVSMLTAVVNLTAMTVTIATSGLAPVLFGDAGLSPGAIAIVLGLLVLFAAFFSAVLLSITSFARSFKEAQAYVIPLMVVSLVPGFITVMPDLVLNPLLSVTPLANIVLLARDVLKGDASLVWGAVAVLSTMLYGALALAMAARIFGSDAILYGSEGSWSDLFRRPAESGPQATPSGALTALAIVAPLFIIASGLHGQMAALNMAAQLAAGAGIALLLFVAVPLGLARVQGVEIKSGFQLRPPALLAWLGAATLGCALAPLVMELILLSRQLGLTMINEQQMAQYAESIQQLLTRWRSLPPLAVLAALAFVPAVSEELFFRGYLLGALRGRMPAWAAILFTGAVFGLFHASLGGVIVLDRVLPSTVLGIVLGWVCWQTQSCLPGMLLHTLNNGLIVSLAYWESQVKSLCWGLDAIGQSHVPLPWLAAAGLLTIVGSALIWLARPSGIGAAAADKIAAAAPPTAG